MINIALKLQPEQTASVRHLKQQAHHERKTELQAIRALNLIKIQAKY